MDLVGWDRDRFEQIHDDFHSFAVRLDIHDLTAILVLALHGDNVVSRSANSPWHEGPAVLSHLEDVYVASDRDLGRRPVPGPVRDPSAEPRPPRLRRHRRRWRPAAPVVEEHVPGRLSASTSAADSNVVRHPSLVTMRDRSSRGTTIWFTGYSGSGKSTVAMLVEQQLLAEGRPAFVLDGDNLRHGLNADLGFSLADRAENLRRLAHVAALIAASGQVVLVPAISPLREHRELAQRVHREAGLDFVCVHVDTPLEVCEQRDAKGLYAKARAGVITEFTGIDSPYEPPHNPDLRLLPDRDARAQADQVIALLGGLR